VSAVKVGPGSVYKRKSDGRPTGSVRWTDENGKQQRVTVYGRTLTEARQKLREIRERLESGGPARDSSVSLSAWTEEWISTALAARLDIEQSSKDTYARTARVHLVGSKLGEMRLGDVQARHLELFLAGKLRTEDNPTGLSASYVRTLHTVLLGVFRTAVRDRLLQANPMEHVARPTPDSREAAHLSVEQARTFLHALPNERLHSLARFLLMTGMRLGEALGLAWEDVDTDSGTIRVKRVLVRDSLGLRVKDRTKSKRNRTVAIDGPALAVLRTRRKAQMEARLRAGSSWRETGLVFTTDEGGPLEPNNLRNRFRAVAAEVGMPEVHFHTFRHSAASLLLEEGESIKAVMEQLGHSSAKVTLDVYGHISERVRVRTASKLGEAFG